MNLILELYLEDGKEELTGLLRTKVNHTMFNLKMNNTILKTRSMLFDFGIYIHILNSTVSLLLSNNDNKKMIVKKLNEIVDFEKKLLAKEYYTYELN
tara:strand:+ start:467 stop:757 length:291 start_codon:yes stop_codon:yes gene_type:complete